MSDKLTRCVTCDFLTTDDSGRWICVESGDDMFEFIDFNIHEWRDICPRLYDGEDE